MEGWPGMRFTGTGIGTLLFVLGSMSCWGCRAHECRDCDPWSAESPAAAQQLQIELPEINGITETEPDEMLPPVLLSRDWPPEFEDLTLEEAVHQALRNSEVVRDLGGLVLRAPGAVRTVHDPAIQYTDPRFGVEAALSAFDAFFVFNSLWENNDRPFNNFIESLGANFFKQDLSNYNVELSKRTALGTELNVRHILDYDYNNSPVNFVPNLPWTAQLVGEIRQPLLQGAGVEFNRIAGPGAVPGVNNGVLVARLNSDISLAQFEAAVRDLVSNVENMYWELYFAYRDAEAKIAARKQALLLLETLKNYERNQQVGGSRSEVAQAEEQYFRLQADVQDAITGRLLEKSNANVFRGTGGVLYYERRLRRAIGLPASDGRLLRPVSEPSMAQVTYDWDELAQEALVRRVELRQQKWDITRLAMELSAARNYLKPRLDAVARYRFRGLGHDLLDPDRSGPNSFDSAYRSMTTGEFQEWGLGVELVVPIGYRTGHAAVRNAELQLARARAILREQEQEVLSDLTAAVAELDRAYLLMRTNYNRRTAAHELVASLELLRDQNDDEANEANILSRLLDAQLKAADADTRFFRALAEYAFAMKQIHYEKGSLLDFNEVYLSEGPSPHKAYHDAAERVAHRRPAPWLTGHGHEEAPVVSAGVYAQETMSPEAPQVPEVPGASEESEQREASEADPAQPVPE
jgi:outer membrane protein TolC